MIEVIAWIVVIGSLAGIFFKAVEGTSFGESPGKTFLNIVLFVPVIIISSIIHVIENFKFNKAGYTALLLVVGFILFGLYKALQY